MREGDIRIALKRDLGIEHPTNSIVISELGLCNHRVRVDVAVINGFVSGYEIKSEADTLERLPVQAEWYSRTLDRVCMVVAPKFISKIERNIPQWWGIRCAIPEGDVINIEIIREEQENQGHDPYCVAQFLWREEALQVLAEYNLDIGLKNKPRHIVWERLAAELPIDCLREEVRLKLKCRENWRADQ
jgi:hypothetical protein